MVRRSGHVIITTAALIAAGGAHAHGGHPVAEGVDPNLHLHAGGIVTLGPEWTLALGLAVVVVGLACWRARRAQRAPGAVRRAAARGRAR